MSCVVLNVFDCFEVQLLNHSFMIFGYDVAALVSQNLSSVSRTLLVMLVSTTLVFSSLIMCMATLDIDTNSLSPNNLTNQDAWQVYAVSSASSVFYKISCLSLPVTWVHNLWQGGPWVVFLLLRFSLFHNQAWQRNMPWKVLKVFHWLILSSSTWPLIGLPWLLASVRTFPLLTNLTAQTVRPIRRTKIWSPKTNICHGKGCPFWYSCVYNKSNVCACVHWFTYNEVCPDQTRPSYPIERQPRPWFRWD